MGYAVSIRVDDDETVRALRDIRRDINRTAIRATERAGRKAVLPLAIFLAPAFARSQMTIKADTRRVRLQVKTRSRKKRAIFAVANFGGTIRAPIVPRKAKALRLANGDYTMRVTGPRRIRGKHWMERAVAKGRRRFLSIVSREIETAITKQLQGGGFLR